MENNNLEMLLLSRVKHGDKTALNDLLTLYKPLADSIAAKVARRWNKRSQLDIDACANYGLYYLYHGLTSKTFDFDRNLAQGDIRGFAITCIHRGCERNFRGAAKKVTSIDDGWLNDVAVTTAPPEYLSMENEAANEQNFDWAMEHLIDDTYRMGAGVRLLRLREEAGFKSVASAARKINVDDGTIHKYEAGLPTRFQINYPAQLALISDVSVDFAINLTADRGIGGGTEPDRYIVNGIITDLALRYGMPRKQLIRRLSVSRIRTSYHGKLQLGGDKLVRLAQLARRPVAELLR